MGRSRLFAVFVAAFCLATGASAQEPEEASSQEPKVDAFQYFFGPREEPEEPAEAAAPVDPEAKKDAFQYLFGRRGSAPVKEEEPAREEPAGEKPVKPAPVKQEPVKERKPAAEAAVRPAPAPAPKPAPVAPAPEAPRAEPKPEPQAQPQPQPKLEEKPKADAFQYFFGSKKKPTEPAQTGPEEKESEEAEKPPR